MIEVEETFALTSVEEQRLLEGARFLRERTLHDTYFDTEDNRLIRADQWLRKRGDRFELKVAARTGDTDEYGLMYHELDQSAHISEALGLSGQGPLAQALTQAGIKPLCTIVTHRRQYEAGEFHIDIDETDFGYRCGEVELLVAHEDQAAAALERVRTFIRGQGVPLRPIDGKVVEWIRRNRPDLYRIGLRRRTTQR